MTRAFTTANVHKYVEATDDGFRLHVIVPDQLGRMAHKVFSTGTETVYPFRWTEKYLLLEYFFTGDDECPEDHEYHAAYHQLIALESAIRDGEATYIQEEVRLYAILRLNQDLAIESRELIVCFQMHEGIREAFFYTHVNNQTWRQVATAETPVEAIKTLLRVSSTNVSREILINWVEAISVGW